MGKRELLIVAAFVIIGAVAYHVTAPAAVPGQKGFSVAALRDAFRNGGRGARARVQASRHDLIPVASTISEISISGASSVIVTGEARADIAWTLDVEAAGNDHAGAQRAVDAVALRHDEMTDVLAVSVRAPREGSVGTTLRLQVPSRLTVRIDSARRVTASAVAALRLDNVSGDVDVRQVPGSVTGAHRNGTLTIGEAGSVSMSLMNSAATMADVRGETAINVRNGAAHFRDLRGNLSVDANNAVLDATRSAAPSRFTVASGSLSVIEPHAEVRVDARGAKVQATLDRAVPMTAIVTGGFRLELTDDVPVTLDAIADGGTIVATDFGLMAVVNDRGATLRHVFGARGRVAVRSDGGEIVITRRK